MRPTIFMSVLVFAFPTIIHGQCVATSVLQYSFSGTISDDAPEFFSVDVKSGDRFFGYVTYDYQTEGKNQLPDNSSNVRRFEHFPPFSNPIDSITFSVEQKHRFDGDGQSSLVVNVLDDGMKLIDRSLSNIDGIAFQQSSKLDSFAEIQLEFWGNESVLVNNDFPPLSLSIDDWQVLKKLRYRREKPGEPRMEFTGNVERINLRGDFDRNGTVDIFDIDSFFTRDPGEIQQQLDVNFDGAVDRRDVASWAQDVAMTYLGDANLDCKFDSTDLVAVFTLGAYEDEVPGNSTWSTGDWDGDGDFTSGDFVAAFGDGGYDRGRRVPTLVNVPEPNHWILGIVILAALSLHRLRRMS